LHHISPVSEPQEDPARGRVQKEACVAVERGRTRLDLYTAGARGRERARAYVHAFTSCTPRQLLYVLNIFLDCQYNTSLTLLLICMCMHLHHVHIDNYCSHTCQKRPTTVSKETYYSVKRDLLQCQKRPTTVSKETYYSVKRVMYTQTTTAAIHVRAYVHIRRTCTYAYIHAHTFACIYIMYT
jgi:hypothetical protein